MGKQLSWPQPWARLAAAAGGVDELARRVASSRRALARYALEGVRPAGPARALLELVARELGVPSPVESSLELDAVKGIAGGARELVAAKKRRAEQVAKAHARFARKHRGKRSSAASTR